MKRKLYFTDCEVFRHDFLWVFLPHAHGEPLCFWNDAAGVKRFLETERPVLCGFNIRAYDAHILRATLLGWHPNDIWELSNTIVSRGDRDFAWVLFRAHPRVELPPVIDLFHDIVPRKSLKEIAGNLGMPILETPIPFDIDRPLTEDERAEVARYCLHDAVVTKKLFAVRYGYLKAKSTLCKLCDLDPLTMFQHTNARMVAEALRAKGLVEIPYERYEIPDNIDLSVIPPEVVEYVRTVDTTNCEDPAFPKLTIPFHGCETTIGLGGIHGALQKYSEHASDTRAIVAQDITSFYPSLIINNGYMSRAVDDPRIYKEFYDLRLRAKRQGDAITADAAKLVLNTTFGAMKYIHNKLYDPMQGVRICLSGELYILDVLQQIHRDVPGDITLIQLNTDGWVLSLPRQALGELDRVVRAWEQRAGFTVETTLIDSIVQANVNNYVWRTVDGEVKTKGGIVGNHKGGDFRSNSATIIDAAVTAYLLDGVPIEETIHSCCEIERFQIIVKAGSAFQMVCHGDREIQGVNRVYATKDASAPGVYKLRVANGCVVARQRIPLTPDHCFVDNENLWKNRRIELTSLDKEWYCRVAKKRLQRFVTSGMLLGMAELG